MIVKKTARERNELRESRKEWQIVIRRSRNIGFEYVLVRPKPGKVFFGSGIERECLPAKGPAKTSIMRRVLPEFRPYPGPFEYQILPTPLKKLPTKYGYTRLSDRSPRTMVIISKNPPVGKYNIHSDKNLKSSIKPFGVGSKLDKDIPVTSPTPGTYDFYQRKLNVIEAFGTNCRRILPAVKVICTPRNLSKCEVCEEIPNGDYWHNWNTDVDLCRPCMIKEIELAKSKIIIKSRKLKRLNELKEFKRARYCGFYHDHSNTTAAVELLPKKVLMKKIRIENYLSMFNL